MAEVPLFETHVNRPCRWHACRIPQYDTALEAIEKEQAFANE